MKNILWNMYVKRAAWISTNIYWLADEEIAISNINGSDLPSFLFLPTFSHIFKHYLMPFFSLFYQLYDFSNIARLLIENNLFNSQKLKKI